MTTDGGSGLQDPYDLVALLGDHVEVVDHEAIADFALRHHRADATGDGTAGTGGAKDLPLLKIGTNTSAWPRPDPHLPHPPALLDQWQTPEFR